MGFFSGCRDPPPAAASRYVMGPLVAEFLSSGRVLCSAIRLKNTQLLVSLRMVGNNDFEIGLDR